MVRPRITAYLKEDLKRWQSKFDLPNLSDDELKIIADRCRNLRREIYNAQQLQKTANKN